MKSGDGRNLLQCESLVAQITLAGFELPVNLTTFTLYIFYQLTQACYMKRNLTLGIVAKRKDTKIHL